MRHLPVSIMLLLLVALPLSSNLLGQLVREVTIRDTAILNMKNIGSADGLSQGMVTSVIQDTEGFIWLATKDGLNRYDGYQMKVFNPDADDPYSLPENHISGLVEDPNGNFWVGTASSGLYRFDKHTEKFHLFMDLKWSNNYINKISYKAGMLLIESPNNFVVLNVFRVKPDFRQNDTYNPALLVVNSENYSAIKGAKTSVYWENRGSMWISTMGQKLYHLWRNKYNSWTIDEVSTAFLPEYSEFDRMEFFPDLQQGRFWIKFHHHFVLFNSALKKTEQHFTLGKEKQQFNVLEGVAPYVFLYSKSGNIIRFNRKTLQFTFLKASLPPGASLSASYIDHQQNSWWLTNGWGVQVIAANSDRFQTAFAQHSVGSLETLPSGEIAFEKIAKTIFFNPNNTQSVELSYDQTLVKLSGKGVLLKDPYVSGRFWQSFLNSKNQIELLAFNAQNAIQQRIKVDQSESQNFHVRNPLLIFPEDVLWLSNEPQGVKRSIDRIDLRSGKVISKIPIPTTLKFHEYPFISHAWFDGHKLLWLATLDGVYCLDVIAFKWVHHYQTVKDDPTSLSNNIVFSICPDPINPQNYLWFGTNGGGLSRLNRQTGKFTHWKTKDGLPNNIVYGVLADRQNNLWLSTNRGLCCFSPPKNNEKPHIQNFTVDDGLANNEFNRYSFLKLADGRLMFGGMNGLTWFDPTKVLAKSSAVEVAFTRLSLFNQEVDFRKDSSILNKPINLADKIVLNYDQDMIKIEFAAQYLGSPERKKYRYFLEGYDKNWIESGTYNFATYTNIPPGSYTFHVKASNNGDDWTGKTRNIQLIITSPWWGTWWFKTIAVLALGGMAYGFYRYRLYQQMKIVKLRDKIALDLHDEIGSTLSSISLFGESVKRLIPPENKASQVIDRINADTKKMMESMSDIVWSLNSKNDTLDNLSNRIRAFAVEMMEAKGAEAICDLDRLRYLNLNVDERKNLYLLLKEAINNAAKYSQCKRLTISLHQMAGEVRIRIVDDGVGFDPGTANSGNGMQTMQHRANQLNASCSIRSAPGEGTQIEIRWNP